MSLESVASNIAWYTNALDYIARSTPFFLVLCGLLAYYYREKIKSILAKSLASEVEHLKAGFAMELAKQQASMQRELEAYKVSLIAEAERAKATQDVRKSIALKFSERRFQAVVAILDIHMGIDTDITTHLEHDLQGDEKAFKKERKALLKRLKEYGRAYDSSVIFLSENLRLHILNFRNMAYDVLALRKSESDPLVDENCEETASLIDISIKLEDELNNLIKFYESLSNAPEP
ncbi:hypothetical protein [Pseudomonas nitroreducens]|uniref:hypothetical protein n=1 Tax=Pseudomonas nitroreducens TaxID=46680 RepID=UPI000B681F83|nr:hypothetical protein [Pseudomonas nitroreducens]NMZ60325.1 hypothetical protein [Pseudomonas nitroreducens]SNT30922.1 hypothetical protein SAMN05216209_4272 [Pseudomonas nitroreducens]